MAARRRLGSTRSALCLASLAVSIACGEEAIPLRQLTGDPVVIGISLSVVEDGPHAQDLGPLPADRPRAEVLPLDVVELDALVVDVDGPRDLSEAVWVLCEASFGTGCLRSLEQQGELHGALEPCTERSAEEAFACEAGRGVRPRVVIPAIVPPPGIPMAPRGANAFSRVAVIMGSPGGPTTDSCLEQLVIGPRVDLRGCAIGMTELVYGPEWTLLPLLVELGVREADEELPPLPPLVSQLLPPNAAPRIEAVRLGTIVDFESAQSEILPEVHSVHAPIEIEAGAWTMIEPVVPLRDQQIELRPRGPDSWIGQPETCSYDVWADAPLGPDDGPSFGGGPGEFPVYARDEGPMRVYVLVTDSRRARSWFVLDLQAVAR